MKRAGFTFAAGRYVFFCGLVVCTEIGPSAANVQARDTDGSGQITIQEIMNAWYARHERVQSAEFKLTEEVVLMPGSQVGRGGRSRDDEGHRFPREPLTLVRHHDVVFQGLRLRHDRRGEDWHFGAEGPVPQHLVQVSDNERDLISYGIEEPTEQVHPRAFVSPATGDRPGVFIGQSFTLKPIFLAFRAQHPAFARPTAPGPFNASTYRVLEREGTIDGRRCVILDEVRNRELGHPHRIWVDPERDFVALRDESGTGNLVLSQLDIEYEQDASGLWVPVRWVALRHAQHASGGRVLDKTATFTVTDYALNPPIDNEVFDFEPPSGTLVDDYTSGDREVFVAREGGQRAVTEDELLRGARYTDLLNTDSGEALLPPGQRSWRWRWIALTVLLGTVTWLFWRRR